MDDARTSDPCEFPVKRPSCFSQRASFGLGEAHHFPNNHLCLVARKERFSHRYHIIGQGYEVCIWLSNRTDEPIHDGRGLSFKLAAIGCQGDTNLPLVSQVPNTSKKARFLHPFRHRGQGEGVEGAALADFLDRAIVFLPEHQKHEVLRIGQAQPLKQGLVGTKECMPGRVDCKTKPARQTARG